MARLQEVHQIFNELDEFGLLVGTERLPSEDNASYRERLLGFRKLQPSSTVQGLINAISKELGLEEYNVIDKHYFWLEHTPDVAYSVTVKVDGAEVTGQRYDVWPLPYGWSDIPAATGIYETSNDGWVLWRQPDGSYSRLLELIDIPAGDYISVEYTYRVDEDTYTTTDKDESLDRVDPLYGLDGYWKIYRAETPNPTSQVTVNELTNSTYLASLMVNDLPSPYAKTIITYIKEASPIGWGDFTWDEAYWQDDFDTFETLPSLFDASMEWFQEFDDPNDFQSGVDGGNSLLLTALEKSGTPLPHPTGRIF